MSDLRRGYVGFQQLKSRGIRPGRRIQPSVRVPMMPVHAAEPDATRAVCGAALAEVSQEPWVGGHGDGRAMPGVPSARLQV